MGNDNGSGFAPAIEFDGVRVFHGDCREVLKSLPDCSVDSIVTDPPYGLSNMTPELVSKTIVRWVSGDRDFIPTGAGFMGKEWDSFVPPPAVWDECLRVLKPGGHLLAFFGSRTMDLGQLAIRLGGFEIRDNVAWLYGSGFPKSSDVSKAIDKKLGAERDEWPTLPMQKKGEVGEISKNRRCAICMKALASGNPCQCDRSEKAITSEAQKWQGWGTALKPAFEPIVVGRKPLTGTVAENVLEWGTGGLNIDGSRINYSSDADKEKALAGDAFKRKDTSDEGWSRPWMSDQKKIDELNAAAKERAQAGRWPANVILDEHTAELLDQQTADLRNPGSRTIRIDRAPFNPGHGELVSHQIYGDSGGASRFFYIAKASKRDRNEGLDGLEETRIWDSSRKPENVGSNTPQNRSTQARKNFHPTVKPTQLMRYLIKLVTPPGGTVLDPFTGSGSTGKAAILDGFKFVGAELTEEYLPIIEGRLKWALENREMDETLF